jgi:hypothetical protein
MTSTWIYDLVAEVISFSPAGRRVSGGAYSSREEFTAGGGDKIGKDCHSHF